MVGMEYSVMPIWRLPGEPDVVIRPKVPKPQPRPVPKKEKIEVLEKNTGVKTVPQPKRIPSYIEDAKRKLLPPVPNPTFPRPKPQVEKRPVPEPKPPEPEVKATITSADVRKAVSGGVGRNTLLFLAVIGLIVLMALKH